LIRKEHKLVFNNKNRNIQITKFASVGILNTIIDFGLYNLFIKFFLLMPPLASIFSATLAMLNSFLLNKKWTFKSEARTDLIQIIKFLAFTLFGIFVIQSFFIIFLTNYFLFFGDTVYNLITLLNLNRFLGYDFISYNFAKLVGVSFALIWNFYTYKKWVFKK
jgi:putative flippase GtrA